MPNENFTFVRDDVLPSWWANAIQRFIGSLTANFELQLASHTTIQVPGGPGDDAAIIGIEGHWRWNEEDVVRAHPGGLAGDYPVFVVTKANDIRNVPAAGSDFTDYSWGLRILAPGTTPPIVAGVVDHFRRVGTARWDGAKITALTQTAGPPSPGGPWIGDVKASLQTADHPGWLLCDGRTNILRSSVPQGFVDAMLALGLNGADATKIGVPDGRGRALFGVGTHADVNVLLESDGLPVGTRSPKHNSSVVDPGHHHGYDRGIASAPNQAQAAPGGDFFWTYDHPNTDHVQTGVSVGPGGVRPTDQVPFLGVNFFVYTGAGVALGEEGAGAGNLLPSEDVQIVTSNLAAGVGESGVVLLGLGYRISRITADHPCRVRLYSRASKRDADIARPSTTEPLDYPATEANPDHGVVIDVVLGAANLSGGIYSQDVTPNRIGQTLEVLPSDSAPYRVTNTDGVARVTTVTIHHQKLEAA